MKTKYESIYGGQETLKIPCERCGKAVKKRVDPSASGKIRVYCHACKRLKTTKRDEQSDNDGGLFWLARMILLQSGASPVTAYRPGDPGFDKIAKQCSFAQEGRV